MTIQTDLIETLVELGAGEMVIVYIFSTQDHANACKSWYAVLLEG